MLIRERVISGLDIWQASRGPVVPSFRLLGESIAVHEWMQLAYDFFVDPDETKSLPFGKQCAEPEEAMAERLSDGRVQSSPAVLFWAREVAAFFAGLAPVEAGAHMPAGPCIGIFALTHLHLGNIKAIIGTCGAAESLPRTDAPGGGFMLRGRLARYCCYGSHRLVKSNMNR